NVPRAPLINITVPRSSDYTIGLYRYPATPAACAVALNGAEAFGATGPTVIVYDLAAAPRFSIVPLSVADLAALSTANCWISTFGVIFSDLVLYFTSE